MCKEIARESPPDDRRPPGLPVRGARRVTATLTALARSARHELLTFEPLLFDTYGRGAGRSVPDPFHEIATVCARPTTDRSPTDRPTENGTGAWFAAAGYEASGDDSAAYGAMCEGTPWDGGGYCATGDGPREVTGPRGRPGRGAEKREGTDSGPQVPAVRRIVPRDGWAGPPRSLPRRLPGRTRQTDSIPFTMVVVDRTVAAVPLDLRLPRNGLLLIRDPVVVQALVRTHQTWWETGEEIPPVAAPCPGVLPRQLRPVLEAMLAGLTDEAAAARLGMSGRTYSRRVGELLAVLGTTSRFRAGTEAARLGWV